MIPGQVREDGGSEAHAVHALQRKRVRGHLHDRRSAALLEHLGEQLLHVRRLGRRARRLAFDRGRRGRHGTHHARGEPGRVEHGRQQVTGRRLAVGAGDADDRHAAARAVEEPVGEQRQRQAARRGPESTERRLSSERARRRRRRWRRARSPAAANATPSAFWPRRATKTAPGRTDRESYAIAVTVAGPAGAESADASTPIDAGHVAERHCGGTPGTSAACGSRSSTRVHRVPGSIGEPGEGL